MSSYDRARDGERRNPSSRPQTDGRRADDPVSDRATTLYGVFHLHMHGAHITLGNGAITIYAAPAGSDEGQS